MAESLELPCGPPTPLGPPASCFGGSRVQGPQVHAVLPTLFSFGGLQAEGSQAQGSQDGDPHDGHHLEGPPANVHGHQQWCQWSCFGFTEGNETILFSKNTECEKPCGPPQIMLNEVIWEGWRSWEDQNGRGTREKTLLITFDAVGTRTVLEGPEFRTSGRPLIDVHAGALAKRARTWAAGSFSANPGPLAGLQAKRARTWAAGSFSANPGPLAGLQAKRFRRWSKGPE